MVILEVAVIEVGCTSYLATRALAASRADEPPPDVVAVEPPDVVAVEPPEAVVLLVDDLELLLQAAITNAMTTVAITAK